MAGRKHRRTCATEIVVRALSEELGGDKSVEVGLARHLGKNLVSRGFVRCDCNVGSGSRVESETSP